MSDRKHVLVVDHNGDVAAVIGETLETLDYAVSLAKRGEEMQALIGRDVRPDVVVLDASSSESCECNLAIQARELGIRVVMISGHPEMIHRFRDRADQLLVKPFRSEQLARAIGHALTSDLCGQRKSDPE